MYVCRNKITEVLPLQLWQKNQNGGHVNSICKQYFIYSKSSARTSVSLSRFPSLAAFCISEEVPMYIFSTELLGHAHIWL